MKKRSLILITLILSLAMLLSACGEEAAPPASSGGDAPQSSVPSEEDSSPAPSRQEYTGEMGDIFGDYVSRDPENPNWFLFDQPLTVREDKTCTISGETYTWFAMEKGQFSIRNGETEVGLFNVAPDGEQANYYDIAADKNQNYVRNRIPADFEGVFKLISATSGEKERPEQIEFLPQWKAVINGKTYRVMSMPWYSDGQIDFIEDGNSETPVFMSESNSQEDFVPEKLLNEGIIKLREKDNGSLGQYVDVSRYDFVDLTEENFFDYFEEVSMAQTYEPFKDDFGDVTGIRQFADYIAPKENVAAFGYTVKLTRTGQRSIDVTYNPESGELSSEIISENDSYTSDSWKEVTFSYGSGRYYNSDPALYLSMTGEPDFMVIGGYDEIGGSYVWHRTRMKTTEIVRVMGTVAIKK